MGPGCEERAGNRASVRARDVVENAGGASMEPSVAHTTVADQTRIKLEKRLQNKRHEESREAEVDQSGDLFIARRLL